MKRVISILAVVCLLCVGSAGAQDYVCGDANYDSVANIDDGAYLFDYLVTGGPAPELPDPAWANWDGHDGLTINDVFACKMDLDSGLYNPVCPVEGPDSPTVGGVVNYDSIIAPMADHIIIPIAVNYSIKAFIFPIRVFIDGLPQAIDSISVLPGEYPGKILYSGSLIYADSSSCVIGACSEGNSAFHSLAYIYLSLTPLATERTLRLDWANLSPLQSPDPLEYISPMYSDYYGQIWVPAWRTGCCDVAGDTNNDGACNVGDAVFIIGYVFRGGSAPLCYAEGDANADGAVNIGDTVFIINYAFRHGIAPTCGPN